MKINVFFLLGLSWGFFMGCHSDKEYTRSPCRVIEAVYGGNVDLLIHELNRGCDPRGNSDHVNEPIWAAIVSGDAVIVNILLDAGVDPNFDWGEEGGNLLTNAAQFGHKNIVVMLLERKANVNASSGHSALYRAMFSKNSSVLDYLKSRGALLNDIDKKALDNMSIPY